MLDRINVLSILPKENNYVTLKLVRDLVSLVGIKDKEFKEFEIATLENGGVKWNDKGNKLKEFEIGEKATDLIVEGLKKLNTDKKLTQQYFDTYGKFVKEE